MADDPINALEGGGGTRMSSGRDWFESDLSMALREAQIRADFHIKFKPQTMKDYLSKLSKQFSYVFLPHSLRECWHRILHLRRGISKCCLSSRCRNNFFLFS